MSGVFDWTLGIFAPLLLSVGIVVAAYVLWRRFVDAPARSLEASLRCASEVLAAASSPLDPAAYPALKERMEVDNNLIQAWQGYALAHDVKRGVISLVPSSRWFTLESIVGTKINLGLVDAIPNVLLGIGLLFTFVGLIIALYFASSGVSAPTTAEAKAALGKLLNAATFKFMTSLAGLGSSIGFTWFERKRLHALEQQIADLCVGFDRLIPVRTAQSMRFDMVEQNMRQTQQLERFNTELAASIGKEIQGRIEPALQSATVILTSAIKGMSAELGSRLGDMNQEAVKKMLESFAESLQGQTREQANALNAALAQQVQHVADVNEIVSGAPARMQTEFQRMLTALEDGSGTITKRLTEVTSTALGAFENGSVRVVQALTEVDRVVHSVRDVAASLGESLRELQGATAPIVEAASSLRSAATDIAELEASARSGLEEFLASSRAANEGLSAASSAIRGSNEAITEAMELAWRSYRERFASVDDEFGKVTQELEKMLDAYRAKIREFAGSVDGHLSEWASKLGSGVSELGDSVGQLGEIMDEGLRNLREIVMTNVTPRNGEPIER